MPNFFQTKIGKLDVLAVKPTLTNLTRCVFIKIWIKSSASTAASQPLTQVSNTAAKTGLTSGFGMGPGRTLPL